ncbi:predicted protein [Naegleria gruberi]|uniref:Predicted protein n=1 Tax=Naegleria gruberi TaxID=5762 RepID=D2VLT6_NAEGR|nr:uncharacterized protein NAEGRDRAFT_69894 [Naegleria gruberi]EFC42111.1 predicted protein [Naegleria gruberi]|eukprot:XP_002674855.1 predicted protein [Naegleria gruberi strain NEG-M]
MPLKNCLIDFAAYLFCPNGWSSSAKSESKRRVSRWKNFFTDKDSRRNHIASEWRKYLVVILYVLINIGLFIEAAWRWHDIIEPVANSLTAFPKEDRLRITWYVTFARGFGQLLNFNSALLIVPTMRTLSNTLRTLKLGNIITLDKNTVFHRYIAYWIVVCTVGHGFFHYLNYASYYFAYTNTQTKVENSFMACWIQKYGITGNLLCLVMYLMYATSHANYRRTKNYTVFWYTHHLFIVFYVLLLVHGKVFWIWFLGPCVLYLFERILRNVRGSEETIVKKVNCLPSRVLELVLEKPRFDYRAGQYCFINCPLISRFEWHAMTISSAPEDEYLHFHIKCAGDWTNAVMDLFNPKQHQTVVIDKPMTPDNKDYLIKIDGPFGTAADEVFDYETVVLIAAGIGATPYASLLKHFNYTLDLEKRGGKPLKIKKCFFYFINRDHGSWEWFSNLLNEMEDHHPEFFELNTYMTGKLKAEEIKKLYFGSSEYQQATGHKQTADVLLRAMYDYTPVSSDELELHANDIISLKEQDESGWWEGTNLTTNESGLFPSNYVIHIDALTKLRENKNRHYGRPDWERDLASVRNYAEKAHTRKGRAKVGVFVCGPPALSKDVYSYSLSMSSPTVQFVYHKENF